MATDCTNKACRLCRLSHTACDGSRPCRRCVALGKPELCQDVEPKKRGRPPKHFPATTEGGWRLAKKQKAEASSKSSSSVEAAKVSNPPSPDSSPTHSPRSSCADLGLHSAGDRAGGGDALLMTLVNELRGTKQELKSEISAFYQTVERRLAQTEEKMNSILSMLPYNASSTVASMPSPHTTTKPSTLSAPMRAELIRQLPFLADFNLDSSTTPFVVDDLGKPVLAQRFSEATRVEDMLPPTIVWANDSFCSLMKVPLYDLLGRRGQGDARTAEMLLPYMLNRGSGLTGDIVPLNLKWPRKDGQVLTLRTRNQVFYNQSGWAKWLLMVVETAEEESAVRIQPAPTTIPSSTPPYCFTHTHPHPHPHPHPHSHPHVHAHTHPHPHPHPHPHAHGHTHVHTPPQQHFMGPGSEEWRPQNNEKEPFSFSAFPSCFSSLPFSLPPRFPGEPGGPNTTIAAATTTPVSDASGGSGSGNGGLGQATTHQGLGSFSSEQSPRTDAAKQGRGEAEMDELLSALISPNSYPTSSMPTAAWEWDCA